MPDFEPQASASPDCEEFLDIISRPASAQPQRFKCRSTSPPMAAFDIVLRFRRGWPMRNLNHNDRARATEFAGGSRRLSIFGCYELHWRYLILPCPACGHRASSTFSERR